MKKTFTLCIALLATLIIHAQVPELISYQAVVRNNSNELVVNTDIGIKISILHNSTSGTVVYEETQNPVTNANGLVTVKIGDGTVVTGDISSIDWADGTYFIKTQIDITGGTSYSISGTTQILSVPYALFAKVADSISGGFNETDPVFTAWDKSTGISVTESQITDLQSYLLEESQTLNNILSVSTDAGNNNISNLANPINDYDAATKAYVDVLKTEILKLKNTNVAGGGITDIEGNYYNTVKIGTQIWMAENLKTTKYNDNTTIPQVTDSVAWISLSTPAYCWYNNDSLTYSNVYGNIYNWYTVNTGKLCPVGWHVPSDPEWETMTMYLGGISVAGGKLKEEGTFYWNSPNTNATNETGFTALPAGDRHSNGGYYNIQSYGFWWTSTSIDANTAWCRYVRNNSGSVAEPTAGKNFGLSVRCVKD